MSGRDGFHAYRRIVLGPLAMKVHRQRLTIAVVLFASLTLASLVALATGSGRAGLTELLVFVASGDGAATRGLSVVGDLRLPRVVMALACGAMLGLSGASLQTLTRNGLADPGLLGVREGASLAVISLMLAFPNAPLLSRPFVGMVGGLCVAFAAIAIARTLSGLRFILIGIGLSWFLSAVLALILAAADIDRVQAAMVWMAGSLAGVQSGMLPVALVSLFIGGSLLIVTARAADVSLLGEATAISLGVRIGLLRIATIAAPVLLTATAVSCAGSLGFVGLIAPHLSRQIINGGQGMLLAGSAIFGAGLVLVADTIGRTLFAPLQIPAGIVLAIIGVGLLVTLIWRRRDRI
ncbi:iron ABC transporter permease [Pararhizobium sp. BT-229]|uniref:FecCD family ABC transporter permease n=1 Tax=Pararhizobium sp. BT-229 TaxID=2986923 RepID=UPI0021F6A6BD|nr:iron ABC transporter permease [Pararhizobium sp. BT-229]MCV9963249.1 iron ABC transporter permease [Pararhizobium sp. BT-229]